MVPAGRLSGTTVAVTRARPQASGFAARLRELGATVVDPALIVIEPLPFEAPALDGYDLLVFTSPNGVACFAAALTGPLPPVAAIGPGTGAALRERGVEPDIVPARSVAEGLVEALVEVPVTRVLLPRAREARELLPEALRARGAVVDVLPVYATVPAPLSGDDLAALRSADLVTFASASAVDAFFAAVGGPGPGQRLVSIGPITSAALREHGAEPDTEAATADLDGLAAAVLAAAG